MKPIPVLVRPQEYFDRFGALKCDGPTSVTVQPHSDVTPPTSRASFDAIATREGSARHVDVGRLLPRHRAGRDRNGPTSRRRCAPDLRPDPGGARGPGRPLPRREEVWLALGSLPFVELGRDEWTRAGELAHELRSRGAAVPLIDLLIAMAAVRADASLWTRDTDFERVV